MLDRLACKYIIKLVIMMVFFSLQKNTFIITYLVSSRPYIEICRVCKIYGRRGGAEPSIDFTNPTYFYVRSGTNQISVLFRQGHFFVLAVLHKIRKFISTADK